MYEALLVENQSHLQRFLAANYFAAENLAGGESNSSLTWERRFAGVSPLGVATFVDTAVTGAQRRSTMMGCQDVISTLDDAARAISADSSAAYCRFEREITGEEFVVNADVIETVVPRTKENPFEFTALKHVTYRSAIHVGPSKGEDYVVLESMGRDVDPDGYSFAFKMARSVDMPGVMAHVDGDIGGNGMTTPKTSTWRGFIHTFVLVLSETDVPGKLRMMVWLDLDLPHPANQRSTDSSRHNSATMQFADGALFSSVSSLHDALSLGLRYRHLIESNFVRSVKDALVDVRTLRTAQAWLPIVKNRRQKCQVCDRKLGLLNRMKRYSCGICTTTLCSTCANVTDTHTWRLCGCCYARNERLFSRRVNAKLVGSGLQRLGYFAKAYSNRSLHSSTTTPSTHHSRNHQIHGLGQNASVTSSSRLSTSMSSQMSKDSRPSYCSSTGSTATSPDFTRPSINELDLINEGSEELERRHNQSMMEEKLDRGSTDLRYYPMTRNARVDPVVRMTFDPAVDDHALRWYPRR